MRPNEVTGSFLDVIGVYIYERLVIISPVRFAFERRQGQGKATYSPLVLCYAIIRQESRLWWVCARKTESQALLYSVFPPPGLTSFSHWQFQSTATTVWRQGLLHREAASNADWENKTDTVHVFILKN